MSVPAPVYQDLTDASSSPRAKSHSESAPGDHIERRLRQLKLEDDLEMDGRMFAMDEELEWVESGQRKD